MRFRLLTAFIAFILLTTLAACGGGTTVSPPSGNDNTDSPNAGGLDQQDLADWADDVEFDPAPVMYRGIPPVPTDGEHTGSQAAGDAGFVVLGKDALDYSQCAINGDAMIINVGAAAATNPDDIPAWALYRVSGLKDVDPLSLNVECRPSSLGNQYTVAVADYSTLEWFWYGPTSLPELEADLTGEGHRFVTNLGNLYFLVVCGGSNVATHYQSTVVVGEPQGEDPPATPARLVASKGEFREGVALAWLPGEGADYFEIWRKGADVFTNDPGLPPGDPGLPPRDPDFPPNVDTWMLIDTCELMEYFDASVLPGFVYMYKVRAVNAVGMSAFSNIDEGWALWNDPPPPAFEGIHGYVFGSYWCADGRPGDPNFDPGLPPGDPNILPPDLMPLAGATLTIAYANSNGPFDGPVFTTRTNADGHYQFLGIQPGAYVIFAELQGWYFPEIFMFEVRVTDESQQFDFFGWPDGGKPWEPEGIHGWVFGGPPLWRGDPDDPTDPGPGLLPLSGVRIAFSGFETDQVELEVFTDDEGFYQVTEIAAGEYYVTASLEGWTFEPLHHVVRVGDEVPSVQLDFFGWQGDIPDPPDPNRAGIYGTAWGDYHDMLPAFMPLAGVHITLSGYPEEILLGETVTDEEGQFAFPNLPPDEYLVSANLEGWNFQPPEYIVEITSDMPLVHVDFWGWQNTPPER